MDLVHLSTGIILLGIVHSEDDIAQEPGVGTTIPDSYNSTNLQSSIMNGLPEPQTTSTTSPSAEREEVKCKSKSIMTGQRRRSSLVRRPSQVLSSLKQRFSSRRSLTMPDSFRRSSRISRTAHDDDNEREEQDQLKEMMEQLSGKLSLQIHLPKTTLKPFSASKPLMNDQN